MSNQSALATRTCRLLYYGPGGAGKRENLQQIIESIPPEYRLARRHDDDSRNISFLLRSGTQGNWRVFVEAADSGSEIYRAGGRNQPGAPFDGIVFVAHSAESRLDQSLSALETLKTYLDTLGLDVRSIPMIIQYNKREEDGCLAVDRLESLMNPWGLLSFPASTRQGGGVKETLKAILGMTISHLVELEKHAGDPRPTAPGPPLSGARKVTDARTMQAVPAAESVAVTVAEEPDQSGFDLVSEDRGGIFFDELRPPIVVPVRIPRRLLEKYGSARIILEIELDDSKSMLD